MTWNPQAPGPAPATTVESGNGHTAANDGNVSADLSVILGALQTMREGDFSVRLPGYWTGLHGKIADTFNEIVATNQQMSRELTRVGQAVGKEGRTSERRGFISPEAPGEKWKSPSTR